MIPRILNPLKSNSFFLFGARGTGKTTFLRQFFEPETTLWIDLLNPEEEDRLGRRPQALHEQMAALKDSIEWVVIDEVQKLPKLLDAVHHSIENTSIKFALTGSSARKLKKGHANLLAGRAFVYHLFPLTSIELADHFDLDHALHWGTLPKLTSFTAEAEKQAFLRAYALTYLKEEIWAEHIIRDLDPFRRFLEIAAQCNGDIINYANVARDVGVDPKTVKSYYEILQDTLVGFSLEPYHRSIRKQQQQSPKFYLFDTGIKRALDGSLSQEILPNTYGYGKAFEHFITSEIFRLNAYYQKDYRFYYLRTKDGAEIDLIVERPGRPPALIEIKSAEQVDDRDTRTLERFLKDFNNAEAFCWSRDPIPKKIGSVLALPWHEGFKELAL